MPPPAPDPRHVSQLLEAGRLNDARVAAERLLAARPDDGQAVHLAGVIAARQQRMDAARPLLRRATELLPRDPEAWRNLGTAHRASGDFDAAIRCFEQALDLAPGDARALFSLSQVQPTARPALLDRVLEGLEAHPVSREAQTFLHFAAGRLLEDLEAPARAFYHYQLGNAADERSFDPAAHRRFIRDLTACFDAPFLAAQSPSGEPSPRPIFIVGMPRSGTTLVEQILASHPKVEAAGELPDIGAIASALGQHAGGNRYPHSARGVPPRAFPGFARAYLKRLAELHPGSAPRVVDKNPTNFLHLGLIRLMFPRAALIHCRRDPVETCTSCYFQMFAHGHAYAFDLGHLGFYYRHYQELMKHWERVLPDPPHEVIHESLVADPEPAIRRLLDHCGLPWHPGCLEPHTTRRDVMTASAHQVRRPIDPARAGRYRAYRRWLGPLENALEQAGA